MSLETIEYKPLIIVIAGHPYSGKSSLGEMLSKGTNITTFDNNARKLFAPGGGEFQNPLLRFAAMNVVYSDTQYPAIQRFVEGDGNPVAIVGTYSHRAYVQPVRELADYHQRLSGSSEPVLKFFVLESPEGCLAERVATRLPSSTNYVSLEDAMKLRRQFMPIEGVDVTHIDTGRLNKEDTLAIVRAKLEPFRKIKQ